MTFDHVAEDLLQDMIDTSFRFYKAVTDDPALGGHLRQLLFDRYVGRLSSEAGAAP